MQKISVIRQFMQFLLHYKKKLLTKQIHQKYPKSVGKLIVSKFTDRFLSLSVTTDESEIRQ